MIKVARGALPPSLKAFHLRNKKSADGVSRISAAESELERAVAFFTNPAHYCNEVKLIKKKFAFRIYKDAEVAVLLESLFNNKCAYCESRFAHVTPKDVEHFRPKSEINTGTTVLAPGYYWLAGTWENLFPSCPDCNRSRTQHVPGELHPIRIGKETQFPLSDERKRLRKSGSLVREDRVRLLLNPCEDDPEKHLTFDEEGLVHPRKVRGARSRMGEASIRVYALQRKHLVEERKRVLNDLRFQVGQLSTVAIEYNELVAERATSAKLVRKKEQIRQLKNKLEEMFHPGSPYLAMLRGWIVSGHRRGEFAFLLQCGVDLRTLLRGRP